MDMSKYVKMYVSESQDRLQRMDGLLLTLEQDGADRGAIDTLFREAHSIKGMSASMGYEELAKVSHRMEDFLEQFRGGKGMLERRASTSSSKGWTCCVARSRRSRPERPRPSSRTSIWPRWPPSSWRPPPPRPRRRARRRSRRRGRAVLGRQQFAVDLRIAPDAPLPSARAYITLRAGFETSAS